MAIVGCFLWLGVVAYCLFLVQWTILGDIDLITGIIGVGLFIGCGVTAFAPPTPELGIASAGVILGSGPMFPIIKFLMHRRDKRDVEVDAIRVAYEGFVFRPDNPSSKIKMARHLWNLGICGHAYKLAESAIPSLPRQYFPDEHRMFQAWQMRPPGPESFHPINCSECGHANVPGNVHCAACGARFLLNRVRGKAISSTFGRRVLGGWLAMVVAILGIPLASRLGGVMAVVIILAMITIAIGAVVLAFRPTKDAS